MTGRGSGRVETGRDGMGHVREGEQRTESVRVWNIVYSKELCPCLDYVKQSRIIISVVNIIAIIWPVYYYYSHTNCYCPPSTHIRMCRSLTHSLLCLGKSVVGGRS